MAQRIGIIDYRMGNLRSVQKALQRLDADAQILTEPQSATDVDKLVLPGVGAFGDGMQHLSELRFDQAVRDFIATGKPFLGICLGMQLLFESSQEDAPSPDRPVPGLNILPGHVVRFVERQDDDTRIKVPHMGWNTLTWQRDDPLLAGLQQNDAVYFVHSYYARPTDEAVQSAASEYPQDRPFCASVWRENVWATQFHPEKSQRVGLRMLDNFVKL